MKQWSVNCGLRASRLVEADGAVDAVDRQEGEAVGAEELRACPRGPCWRPAGRSCRRVDAVVVGVRDRRRGDAHVHLAGARLVHQLHDLLRGGAAHDAVVDEHDALAADDAGIGRMLELDAERADALLRLDEGAADVVVADDAELEGDVGFLRKADGRGDARSRGSAR